ncbi:MAG: hypothetical protein AAFR65_13115 [Pseudomonadota bacterium]
MSLFQRQALAPTLSLFASTGTLVCCALPALFITLGMGATFAGLVSAVPQLIWLSQYKVYVFLGAGVMLGVASYSRWRSRNDPCPIDPELARACTRMRVIGGAVLWVSVILYAVGGFFAFIAPRLI